MLAPEVIDGAGDRIAALFSQVEAELLDHLARSIASGEALSQKTFTGIVLLAQTKGPELRAIVEAHRGEIDAAVFEECERFLSMSDDFDREVAGGERIWPQQLPETVEGLSEWMSRTGLDMERGAQEAFVKRAEEAVARVALGTMTIDAATRRAVRELEGKGISIVRYSKDGSTSYRMHADAAVRQQVRTQVNRACEKMTMRRMEDVGLDLVEVSSHVGARPSHREWEGRCYSLAGRKVIDGTVYEDYYEACRVGDLADGIYGYNCRHSVMPYIHGTPTAYEPEPSHPSGLSSEEVYDLVQGQRLRERRIREAKRQLSGAELLYKENPTPENALELQRARDRLSKRQADMRSYIDDANSRGKAPVLLRDPQREWAGDMPARSRISPSMRSVNEFMALPSVRRSMEANGITKAQLRASISEELADQGGIGAFAGLRKSEQQGLYRKLVNKFIGKVTPKPKKGTFEPDALHPETIAGVKRTSETMTFDQADRGKANPGFDESFTRMMNCQACVVADEARRKGYDVIAKPYDRGNRAMEALAAEPHIAFKDPVTGELPELIRCKENPTYTRFYKLVEATVKDGERYALRIQPKGEVSGHVLRVDRNTLGELRIYDPQSGDIYEGRALRNYLKGVKYTEVEFGLRLPRDNYLFRTDDKAFNSLVVDEVLEAADDKR